MRVFAHLLSTWLLLPVVSQRVVVRFFNGSPLHLTLSWHPQKGHPEFGKPPREVAQIAAGNEHQEDTFVGHVFSVRSRKAQKGPFFFTCEKNGLWTISVDDQGKLAASFGAEEEVDERHQLQVKRCIEALEYFRDVGGDPDAVKEDAVQFCRAHPKREHVTSHIVLDDETWKKKIQREMDDRRVKMVQQPAHLPNFTTQGFLKLSSPFENDGLLTKNFGILNQKLRDWYEQNRLRAVPENHGVYNAIMNSRESDSWMVHGLPDQIKKPFLDELQAGLERWAGWKEGSLRFSGHYGPRIYRNGSVLYEHVDIWESHVLSAIIPISMRGMQDPDGWPLYIKDHQGKQHKVEHYPGDVIFYESATCPHGKENPLQGREVASIFVHFHPKKGWKPIKEGVLQPHPFWTPKLKELAQKDEEEEQKRRGSGCGVRSKAEL